MKILLIIIFIINAIVIMLQAFIINNLQNALLHARIEAIEEINKLRKED